jgi:hypothetical protein
MAKLELTPLVSAYQAVPALNANNDLIEDAIENTISRDGTSPNQMNAVFDMNSNRIINLGDAVGGTDAVTLQQVVDLVEALVDFDSGQGLLPASIVSIADLAGIYTAINVEGALEEVMTAVLALGQPIGASTVGIDDLAGNYVATDVEAALAEIITIFGATVGPSGASKVGIEDAGGFYTASNVEAALQEVKSILAGTGGAATVGSLDTGGFYTATDVEGILQEIGPQLGVTSSRRGAKAFNTSGFTFIFPNNPTNPPVGEVALPLGGVAYDTDSIHSGANNTRLTVPAGVSVIKLRANVQVANSNTGFYHMRIRKNGGSSGIDDAIGFANSYIPHAFQTANNNLKNAIYVGTGNIEASPGDYFELYVVAQNDGNVFPETGACWMEMEIIE